MTRLATRIATLVTAAFFAAALDGAELSAQQKVVRGMRTTPTVSVRIFAAVGELRVTGWDRDSVDLGGVVASGSKVSGAGRSSEAVSGMKLFIEAPTEQASREGRLVLRVPRGAQVWVKTGTAAVEVSGITGGVDVNVVGGSITVQGSPRELRAESMDARVSIEGSPEWVRVKTATGDIVLRGGQNVGASTISGSIDASGGVVERATLETTTGAIRFALGLARGASVELETHSGPIELGFASTAFVELDAATITGTIENRLTKQRPAAGREGRGMTLVTSGGTMSARVQARSFKGRIQISPASPFRKS